MTSFVTPTPPLTTIFTPPASCTDVVTYNGDNFWQGELYELGDLNCYPAYFTYARNKFYSPGVCPNGWYSASSVSGTGALVFKSTESNALCCPTGYQAIEPSNGPTAGNTIFCGSVIDSTLTNVYPTSTLNIGPLPAGYTSRLITVNPATLTVRPTVWAEVIQVRWQSTDTIVRSLQSQQSSSLSSASSRSTQVSSSSSSTSSSTITSTSQSATASQTSTTPTNNSNSSSDSLSTGAKAGIGLGAAALVLILIFGILLLTKKKKKRTSQHSDLPLVPTQYQDQKNLHPNMDPRELDGYYTQTNTPPVVHGHSELGAYHTQTSKPPGLRHHAELAG